MKVTKRIKKIVDKANNALYSHCLCNLIAADRTKTKQRRANAERSAEYLRGYRTALIDVLWILGINTDEDIELNNYSEAMAKATQDYEKERN